MTSTLDPDIRQHSEYFVELENVTLSYGRDDKKIHALGLTDLRLEQGDFVALVGPSGCGKSTILKLVSGLINATTGYVYVAGRQVGAEPVRVGMAFQNPTMLPWLTVRENVMLPWEISGGMLQRASLCRALVHEPQLLMLDEPFGALDQFTREELWAIMQELWTKLRPTVLLVTHDLKEASYLANRICVMRTRPGQIIDDAEVPFPRPRTIEMSYTPPFVALTQRLRELIVSARPVKEAA